MAPFSDIGIRGRNSLAKLASIVKNNVRRNSIVYVTEPMDWVIKAVGKEVAPYLKHFYIEYTAAGARNCIVHFGSITTLFTGNAASIRKAGNSVIVTWYHVVPDDTRLGLLSDSIEAVTLWHTASERTKNDMVKLGIPASRIRVIPLGVNLDRFTVTTDEQRKAVRSELGIPEGYFVIGSFQKDGNGWGGGDEPKLIKGPDIFCEVVERLAHTYKIFVVLTGPSRGYVKKRLQRAGISYVHHYLGHRYEVASFYKALDLYLMTSRLEGGPLCVPESLASGIPIISTKVGLATDVIRDGENGFLCDVGDIAGLVEKCSFVFDNTRDVKSIVDNGLSSARSFDWRIIADAYATILYGSDW